MKTESTGKWVQYSIVAFGVLPLMPNALTALLPIFLFAASALWYLQRPKEKINWKALGISTSLFFAYAFSMCYSADLDYAFKRMGPAAWIITFPVVFQIFLAAYRMDARIPLRMLRLFTASTLAYLAVFALYLTGIERPDNPYLDFPTANFFRNALTEIPAIDRHPIYLSLFLGISVLFTVHRIISEKHASRFGRISQILVLAVLILGLVAIQGKGAMIYLFLTIPIVFLGSPKRRKRLLTYYLLSVAVILFSLALNPDSNNRFKEILAGRTYSEKEIDPYNSSQLRLAIWSTATALIVEAPLLGYGIGDVQQQLNERYGEISPVLLQKQYNSHNQFLGIWLATGIIGLALFLIFLIWSMRAVWRYGEYLWLSLLLLMTLNLLTENLIDRQLGALSFFFLTHLCLAALSGPNSVKKETDMDTP